MQTTQGQGGRSSGDEERRRAEKRDSRPAVVVAVVSVVALAVSDLDGPMGTAVWAVLMLALSGLVVRAEVRSLRRADEYQRSIQLEALALGFVLVMGLLWAGSLVLSLGLRVEPRVLLHVSFMAGLLGWLVIRTLKSRYA